MDDAITPIYSSAFESFDEETRFKDNNLITSNNRIMQPIPEDIELLKPSNSSILGFESEIDLDLCQYFEDVPLNMEEFNEQYTFNSMLGTLVACNNNNDDIIRSHQDILTALNDASDQTAASTNRDNLQLELNSIIETQEEINTPAIIQMLLEDTENAANQTPLVVQNYVPAVLESSQMEAASGSNQVQKKGVQKRATSDSGDDLRRLRNNEASRKSRQNRRERLTGQLSMLSRLEKEHQELTVKVKELEQLKGEIMKYLKKDHWKRFKEKQTKQNVASTKWKLPFQHSTVVF